ncbi:hypothetical protein Pcinc_002411 [Petrolisthes cinctipes]|uniref:TRPM-like domain-containing protein n=1 Tax=Petrolisthes cinctipes TaxID=88211 RepID=A0AAE1L309_PETCI|nr:hypothetical protein Pcinc_002411 [Petrolisthes cinctipes]
MTPNSHLTQLLQRSSHRQHDYFLVHVHQLLEVVMKKHTDPPYLADTPEAKTNTSVEKLKFQDPYQELLLWAILSRRNNLAQYLWQRSESPLSCAVAASSLYKALWISMEAKITDIRSEYWANMEVFEKLASDFLQQCYNQDIMNAMGLVERRNAKWGDLDCLELAVVGKNRKLISTPAAQASIEISWRRGMTTAPSYAVFFANFLPLLIYMPRIFSCTQQLCLHFMIKNLCNRFQKLGDNRDDLTELQKFKVFYMSPISKFYLHATCFVLFLLLYSYIVLFDFKYEMTIGEKVSSNYRTITIATLVVAISLLSCLAKTAEKMVLARLQWHIGPSHPHIFGYTRGVSTADNRAGGHPTGSGARPPPTGAHIDSRAGLQALQQPHPKDNVGLITTILGILQSIAAQGRQVKLNWISSHVGVRGNESADAAAKRAVGGPQREVTRPGAQDISREDPGHDVKGGGPSMAAPRPGNRSGLDQLLSVPRCVGRQAAVLPQPTPPT